MGSTTRKRAPKFTVCFLPGFTEVVFSDPDGMTTGIFQKEYGRWLHIGPYWNECWCEEMQ